MMNKTFKFVDTGATSLSVLTLEEYNSMTGIHITPSVIETKNDYLFAAGDSQNTFIGDEGFTKYDSRSYSFDINKVAHLYQYDDRSNVIQINGAEYSKVPDDYDAYNIYTDVNEEYKEGAYGDGKGEYDRFDLSGYYGGDGQNISWRFVISEITGDASEVGDKDYRYGRMGSNTPSISVDDGVAFSPKNIKVAYVRSDGSLTNKKTIDASSYFDSVETNSTYANPAVSYFMKSLRRNEVYRYGIVFYDNTGGISPVKWIADIRTPNIYWKGFNAFVSHGKVGDKNEDLVVRPLGIEFNVKTLPTLHNGKKVIGYEIVRCPRTIGDIATLSQGVISRPVRALVNLNTNVGSTFKFNLTPQGLINSNIQLILDRPLYSQSNVDQGGARLDPWETLPVDTSLQNQTIGAFNGDIVNNSVNVESGVKLVSDTNYDDNNQSDVLYQTNESSTRLHNPNTYTYQFISPEVCFTSDSFKQAINRIDLSLQPQMYLFGSNYSETVDRDFSGLDKNGNANKDNKRLYKRYGGDGGGGHDNPASEPDIWELMYLVRPFANTPYNLSVYQESRSIGLQYRYFFQYLTGMNKDEARAWTNVEDGLKRAKSRNNSVTTEMRKLYNQYGYIKYYESSNTVDTNNQFMNTMYSYKPITFNGVSNPDSNIETHSANMNEVSVLDTSWPEQLKWNDFLENTADVGKDANWNVTAKEKLTAIGTQNFNNWVYNGYDAVPYKTVSRVWGYTHFGNDKGTDPNSDMRLNFNRLGGAMGVPGPSLLMQLNISTGHQLNNTNFTHSHFVTDGSLSDIRPEDASWSNGDIDHYVNSKTGRDTALYRNSIVGTYLCNLRHSVIPYGGSSNKAKSLNTYTSYGDYFDATGTNVIFDGDCFIQPFEYVSMHKFYHSAMDGMRTACIVNAIPVETSMNLYYQYGCSFSKSPQDNIQPQAGNVNNQWVQKNDMYVYNQVYSQNNNSRTFAAYDNDNNDIKAADYRCYYSNLKENNEIIDNWLKFMPSNYLDADAKYGAITELRTFKDRLVFWQRNSTGIFSVNERATITDSNNEPLILGTGGVMSRYDYISNNNGMRDGEFADTQSDGTLYWWDHDRHEICGFSQDGGVVILSKTKQIQNYINDQDKKGNLSDTPVLFYDKDYNEVLFNIFNNDGEIMYSEFIGQFVSQIDSNPAGVVLTENNLYIIRKDGDVYDWNSQSAAGQHVNERSKDLIPMVDFVVNKDPQYTKVYDNGEMFGKSDCSKDNIRISFLTPTRQKSQLNGTEITNRESNFDYRIPRAFDEDGKEAVFGDRLRGKNIHIVVDTDSPVKDFSLGWVITKYRISWS